MSQSALIENYLAGVPMLRQAVAGMSREQLVARPVPGKWSTLEVVCHIADFDPIYAERMKRIIADNTPTFFGADDALFVKSLCYHDRDLGEELALIENTRRQLARILRTLPSDAFQQAGTYRDGDHQETRTVEKLLTQITNHIPHHVKFIQEKRKALGLG